MKNAARHPRHAPRAWLLLALLTALAGACSASERVVGTIEPLPTGQVQTQDPTPRPAAAESEDAPDTELAQSSGIPMPPAENLDPFIDLSNPQADLGEVLEHPLAPAVVPAENVSAMIGGQWRLEFGRVVNASEIPVSGCNLDDGVVADVSGGIDLLYLRDDGQPLDILVRRGQGGRALFEFLRTSNDCLGLPTTFVEASVTGSQDRFALTFADEAPDEPTFHRTYVVALRDDVLIAANTSAPTEDQAIDDAGALAELVSAMLAQLSDT